MGLLNAPKTTSKGLLGEETTATEAMMYGDRGEDVRGLGRDQAVSPTFGDFAKSAMMGLGVFGGLPGMLGLGTSMATGKAGILDALGIDLFGGGKESMAGVPGLGIENGQQTMASPELQGRSDPSQSFGPSMDMADIASSAADLEASGSGLYAKGGKVTKGLLGMDPPGPDNVVIGAKTGERILNAKQYAALSKDSQVDVDRVLKAKKK